MKILVVDTKCTIWHRAKYKVKNNVSPEKLLELIEDEDIEEEESEYLYETSNDLSLSENNGQPTIEVLNENLEVIWDNL